METLVFSSQSGKLSYVFDEEKGAERGGEKAILSGTRAPVCVAAVGWRAGPVSWQQKQPFPQEG